MPGHGGVISPPCQDLELSLVPIVNGHHPLNFAIRISYFSCCCHKVPDESQPKAEGFIVTQSLRGCSLPWPGKHGSKSWRLLVPLHLQSGIRENE